MDKKVSLALNGVNLIKYVLYKEYNLPKEMDINLTQERILMTVKNSIHDSMVSISRSVGLEKGPFSKSVDKLEELELLKRVRSANDKRFVYLELTPKGKRLAEEIEESMERHFTEKIQCLTKEELHEFYASLEVLKKTAQLILSQ